MFLQPASFMIYNFMTYHGIKACTRMRPVLRTARWKSKYEEEQEVSAHDAGRARVHEPTLRQGQARARAASSGSAQQPRKLSGSARSSHGRRNCQC